MRKILVAFSLIVMIAPPSGSWGLTITKPIAGSVFHPGDNVVVKAEAAPGENLKGIFFFTDKMEKSIFDFQPPYEFEFKIESDFVGALTIVADGKLTDNANVVAKLKIAVELPSNIILKKMSVYPQTVFLYKMPSSGDPNDAKIFESKRLGVSGLYSDSVERQISSSAAGTTYTSSDEKIITVSPEGIVTAKGIGSARVTVKNGEQKADVRIIVEQYKD